MRKSFIITMESEYNDEGRLINGTEVGNVLCDHYAKTKEYSKTDLSVLAFEEYRNAPFLPFIAFECDIAKLFADKYHLSPFAINHIIKVVIERLHKKYRDEYNGDDKTFINIKAITQKLTTLDYKEICDYAFYNYGLMLPVSNNYEGLKLIFDIMEEALKFDKWRFENDGKYLKIPNRDESASKTGVYEIGLIAE